LDGVKGFLSKHFKKAAVAVLAPVLLLSTSTLNDNTPPEPAMTAHSVRMDNYNSKFSAASPFDYTFFLDRDQIQARAAALDPALTYEDAMIKGLRAHLLEQSGIILSEATLKGVVGSLGVSAGQANNREFKGIDKKTGRVVEGRACFINPQDPDRPSRTIRNLIMGFNTSHGDLATKPLRRDMTPEVLRRFNEYHELGHCMNREYIDQLFAIKPTPENAPRLALLKHESETRADVFAALMLARDGVNNVAAIRADHRLIAIATTGYQIAKQKGWDTADAYAGYKYAVHEALWDTQRTIDRIGIGTIKKMTPQQIAALTKEIVDRESLNTPEAGRVVTALLKSRFDLQKMEADYPALRDQRDLAVRVRGQISDAFNRVYGPDAFDPNRPIFVQIPLDGGKEASAPKPAQPTLVPDMAAHLLKEAGGETATQKTLAEAVADIRDALRQTMREGRTAQQDQASSRLQAIPRAHREAAVIIQRRAAPGPAVS